MVAAFTFTVDSKKVEDLMDAFPDRLGVEMRQAFNVTGQFYEDQMKTKHFTGAGKDSFLNPFPDKLRKRTGKTFQGIRYSVKGKTVKELSLSMIARGPHVFVHEFGATGADAIVPKRARALTIPTREALTRGGALKGGFRLVNHGGKHQTADGDPTFIIGDLGVRGSAGIYVDKDDKLIRIYTLKRRVEIPARLGFFREWETNVRGRLTREIERSLVRTSKGTTSG